MMNKCIKCGSYAFNLYKEDIDQGGLCDVHYWQGRAHRAEALAEQPAQQEPVAFIDMREWPPIRWRDGMVRKDVEPFDGQGLFFVPPAQQQEPVGTYSEIFESMRALLQSGRQADQQIYMAMQDKPLYASPPAQRKLLTDEEIDLLINGRGDEDDDDYVEPTGDGFGLTDADLVRLVRRVEAAHDIKE